MSSDFMSTRHVLSKALAGLLAFLLLGTAVLQVSAEEAADASAVEPLEDTAVSDTAPETGSQVLPYADYRALHKDAGYSGQRIEVDITRLRAGEGYAQGEWEGKPVLITEEEGYLEWAIEVPQAGLYTITLEYMPLPGEELSEIPLNYTGVLPKGNNEDVERSISIDGTVPFSEVESVLFTRTWKDATGIQTIDNNDVRPNQAEVAVWKEKTVTDSLGYYGEALYFYLPAGTRTLRFTSMREPMAIRAVTLESKADTTPGYEEYLQTHKANGAQEITGLLETDGYRRYEAEITDSKSNASIYPLNDRSSAMTYPSHYSRIRLNNIGGDKWVSAGQWITWNIEVPKTGLYQIVLRSRQNTVRGMFTSRKLYIDGEIPFKEAESLRFNFSDDWQVAPLGGTETPYLFYLEEGTRQLTMTVTMGGLGEILAQAETSLETLNEAYWQLLTIIGTDPDEYRDYKIDRYHPEVLETFQKQAKILEDIALNFEKTTNQTDSYTAVLHQMALLLENMAEEPGDIPSSFTTFKENISALGNWIAESRKQPLNIDYILLAEQGAALPRAECGFWDSTVYFFRQFLASFVDDYSVGSGQDGANKTEIVVWIGSGATGGRDQANVLHQIVNNSFAPTHPDIHVNLQLIPPGTILTASLAGRGPDVALQIGSTDVVNYAMRNALVDMTQLEGYEEISQRFYSSALLPFQYAKNDDHTGVYAIPETQVFPMMFYRSDILEGLGIKIEDLKTWDDIIAVMPVLQKKHMTFGLPSSVNTYAMFLYQNGGAFYKNGGRQSDLDSKIALESFRQWTNFYVSYRLDLEYNFETRFRMGEMPLAIADYTSFNLLSVSAPEIRGQWGMTTVPGVRQEDGSIVNVAPATVSGAIILESSDVVEESWDFLKWWTEASTQEQFGRDLESVLGTAGRYNSANIEALNRLPWPAKDRKLLMEQWANTQGIPEVPGSYYTSRYLDFALRDVVNKNMEAREVLRTNVGPINEEISIKRNELGLD